MSRFQDIEVALIKGVKVILDANSIPFGVPGIPLASEDKPDDMWVQLHHLRGESVPVTVGDDGEDNNSGILQIDLNYPEGSGSGAINNLLDTIATSFPPGHVFTSNGQNVRITRSTPGPGRYIGGYYRVNLDLGYYSRTLRNP